MATGQKKPAGCGGLKAFALSGEMSFDVDGDVADEIIEVLEDPAVLSASGPSSAH